MYDDKKLPSNNIQNSEADNHDCCKRSDYENVPEDVPSPDDDIEPLSLFAEDRSEVDSVLAFNHNKKDTYHCKQFKAKETSNDSGGVIDPKITPKVKTSHAISNQSIKGIMNQNEEAGKSLNKTKNTRSVNEEPSAKPKRFRKFGYSRWGRKEDTQMFSMLRAL